MTRKSERKMAILSGMIAGAVFLVLLFVLHWAFPVATGIAFLLLIGLQLVTRPTRKIGDTPITGLPQGERLERIYEEALVQQEELTQAGRQIKNKDLAAKTEELIAMSRDILHYLSQNPHLLSRSEHFLSYYLGTGNRILKNYLQLQASHVSERRWQEVETSTQEAMNYLLTIFSKQRDGYHKNTIMDLEAESELLEKTVKLGGDQA